jgi:hypothetical protein
MTKPEILKPLIEIVEDLEVLIDSFENSVERDKQLIAVGLVKAQIVVLKKQIRVVQSDNPDLY